MTNKENCDLVDCINSCLAIAEVYIDGGKFDDCKDEKEKREKVDKAVKTLKRITDEKGITLTELVQRTAKVVSQCDAE